jgi:enamine deaminase RidA (YjgF/YER057c/UK114 family)
MQMALELLEPEGLPRPAAYTQAVVARGHRTVFVSGQISVDAHGELVAPGDLAGQARQALGNVRRALAAAGATPSDITKMTTYVVGYRPDHLTAIREARRSELGDVRPASTLVGVEALFQPEFLIEVEAVAVLD